MVIKRSQGLFYKRENIGLILGRYIGCWTEEKMSLREIFWNSRYFEARMKENEDGKTLSYTENEVLKGFYFCFFLSSVRSFVLIYTSILKDF